VLHLNVFAFAIPQEDHIDQINL